MELILSMIPHITTEMVVKQKKKKLSKSKQAQPTFNTVVMNHLMKHSMTVAFIYFLDQTFA